MHGLIRQPPNWSCPPILRYFGYPLRTIERHGVQAEDARGMPTGWIRLYLSVLDHQPLLIRGIEA